MGLYRLRGRLSQLGQCVFDNDTFVYAYVEIIGPDGRRILVNKVAVCNDVGSGVHPDMEGDFYFDKLFICGRRARCQLWGFTTAERRIIDSVNLRNIVMRAHLFWGVLTTPILALGLTHLIAGFGQFVLFLTGATSRRRFLDNLDGLEQTASSFVPTSGRNVTKADTAHAFETQANSRDVMMRR